MEQLNAETFGAMHCLASTSALTRTRDPRGICICFSSMSSTNATRCVRRYNSHIYHIHLDTVTLRSLLILF